MPGAAAIQFSRLVRASSNVPPLYLLAGIGAAIRAVVNPHDDFYAAQRPCLRRILVFGIRRLGRAHRRKGRRGRKGDVQLGRKCIRGKAYAARQEPGVGAVLKIDGGARMNLARDQVAAATERDRGVSPSQPQWIHDRP